MQSDSTPTNSNRPVLKDQETTKVSPRPLGSTEQLQKGDLFASRYEITERINDDGIVRCYLALDVKSNKPVLLSVLAATLLPNANERLHMVEQLKACMGQGLRSAPIDAGYDGSRVYVVEPHPGGVPLRQVLRARASKAQRYRMQELAGLILPLREIIGEQMQAEVHGSLRAEVVWVDLDKTVVTGWHLMRFLPPARIKRVLQHDRALKLAFAPEASTGNITKASDCYSIAVIVYEALTGRLPDPDAKPIPALGAVGEELSRCLRRELNKRSASIDALANAIQEEAVRHPAAVQESGRENKELFSAHTDDPHRLYSEDTHPQGARLELSDAIPSKLTVAQASKPKHARATARTWVTTLTLAFVLTALIITLGYVLARSLAG